MVCTSGGGGCGGGGAAAITLLPSLLFGLIAAPAEVDVLRTAVVVIIVVEVLLQVFLLMPLPLLRFGIT